MEDLLSFLIVISAGLFLSEIFRRFHLPYVIAMLVTGILIGPYCFDAISLNGTLDFLGTLGLVFLMFMAGLEIKLSHFSKIKGEVTKISIFNGLVPFAAGFLIGQYFGYGTLGSLLIGIIFISSSVAVVIPSLESHRILKSKLGKIIVSSTVLEDGMSLILLSIILQVVSPTTFLPLPLFYVLLVAVLIAMKFAIPKIDEFFFSKIKKRDLFEQELRFIFVVLIGTVVLFEILGMHAIIAGFFTGLILSDTIKSSKLKDKLHALSYGLFIPIFFIIVGMNTDITVFLAAGGALVLTAAIVIGSMATKFVGGWLGGRLSGLNSPQSLMLGAATIPQLSTSLAVAFIGFEFDLLDHKLITALVVLSIVTTFAGPFLMGWICPECKLPEKKKKPLAKLKMIKE